MKLFYFEKSILIIKWFLLLLSLVAYGILNNANSQCVVKVFADPLEVVCGGSTELSAFGSGDTAFFEGFNSGASPVGWDFTQTLDFSNPCSPNGSDGTPHMWMGDASDNPRDMITVDFDITFGGTICFDLLLAEQGGNAPCEGPDEPTEGVYVQYSTDNGTTWKTINYFNPNGGRDPQLTTWNNYCFPIPTDGNTPTTRFRWHQDTVSASVNDHWGIDNVLITLNKPNATITFDDDGTMLPHPGGVNPNKFKITADQTFSVTMQDGAETCIGTVDVKVKIPDLIVVAGNDTSICEGECSTLNSTVKVIVDSAKTPTYANTQADQLSFSSTFAGTSIDSVNINITELNMPTINPGSITEVCIFEATSDPAIPGFGASINDVDVKLRCPDGQEIDLIPAGTTTGLAFPSPSSYIQTCFSPGASADISTGTAPYTGTWSPIESFDNLVGCTSNGVWSIVISPPPAFLSAGTGVMTGWSISFDDPENSYIPDLTWSPTTDFQNPAVDVNAPQPTICPSAGTSYPTTYYVTASDTANCITKTDSIEVDVKVCCALQIDDTTLVKPTCGNADGEIDIVVSGAAANLTFSINDGSGYQTPQSSSRFINLPAGFYDIIVNDVVNCPDTILNVALIPNNSPTITNVVASPAPSCGANDGGITITANGGTGALEYSIDDGANYSSNSSFTMQAEGQYRIKVRDALGCEYPELFDLVAAGGASITNVTVVDPTCGGSDGSITVTASGGSGSYMYSLDMATPVASNVFSNLSTGTYNIVVSDGSGCTADSMVLVGGAGSLAINRIDTISPTCGINNGEISIIASGGTAPLTYRIDTTIAFSTNSNYTSLSSGSYFVEVQDNNGCKVNSIVKLKNPTTLEIALTSINAGVGCVVGCNGSANVVASGGNAPGGYIYNWTNGISSDSASAHNLCEGIYSVIVSDDDQCRRDTTFIINQLSPIADFAYRQDPDSDPFNPVIEFTNLSQGAYFYDWDFGTVAPPLSVEDASVAFPLSSVNTYEVCLTARDSGNCADLICKDVEVKSVVTFYAPNAITVDGNSLNDNFIPMGIGWEKLDYRLRVFDRWGDLIFEGEEYTKGWNGKVKGDGRLVPEGIYIWEVELSGDGFTTKRYYGHVNVLIAQ